MLSGYNSYIGKTILNAGTLVIDSQSRLGGDTGSFVADQLTLNGGTLQTTATFSLSGSNRGVTLGGSVAFSPNSGTTFTISNTIAGAGTINQTGAGTLGLRANTFSGGTILSAGQININSNTALGATGNWLTIAGDGTCKIDSTGNTFSNSYPQAWNADFTFVGTNSLNLGTSPVSLDGNRQVTVNGSTLTVGGVVSGSYSLTKAGIGTLALSGNNAYTGKTIVNAGALSIASESGLGSSPDSFTADQLTLNGGTLQTTATCSIGSGNRGVTLGAGGGTFSPNSGTTLTAVNPIAGSGALIKAGSGTLTLPTANTYAGGTTPSAGQINLNNPAALPAGTFTISGGTIGNSAGAAFALANNNPQTWTGSFKFVGPQDLDLGSGAVTLGSSPTLTVSAGTLTVDGPISGGYSLTKAGSGTLVLSGANQYTGTTSITAGKLIVNGSLASTGAVTVQNGGTLGGIGSIAGLVTVNSGGHIAPGDSIGTLNLAGNLTLASGGTAGLRVGTGQWQRPNRHGNQHPEPQRPGLFDDQLHAADRLRARNLHADRRGHCKWHGTGAQRLQHNQRIARYAFDRRSLMATTSCLQWCPNLPLSLSSASVPSRSSPSPGDTAAAARSPWRVAGQVGGDQHGLKILNRCSRSAILPGLGSSVRRVVALGTECRPF